MSPLTLSWRRSLSYRRQSIDLQSKTFNLIHTNFKVTPYLRNLTFWDLEWTKDYLPSWKKANCFEIFCSNLQQSCIFILKTMFYYPFRQTESKIMRNKFLYRNSVFCDLYAWSNTVHIMHPTNQKNLPLFVTEINLSC